MLLHFPHILARVSPCKNMDLTHPPTVALIRQRKKDGDVLCFRRFHVNEQTKGSRAELDFHLSMIFFPYSPVLVFQVDYVDLRLSHIFTHVRCGHTASLRATIWSILAAGIKICLKWIYSRSGGIALQSDDWRILQVLRKKRHWPKCTGR